MSERHEDFVLTNPGYILNFGNEIKDLESFFEKIDEDTFFYLKEICETINSTDEDVEVIMQYAVSLFFLETGGKPNIPLNIDDFFKLTNLFKISVSIESLRRDGKVKIEGIRSILDSYLEQDSAKIQLIPNE